MPQKSDIPPNGITPAELVDAVHFKKAEARAKELLAVGCDEVPWNTEDEEPASTRDRFVSDEAYEIPNASWSKNHRPSILVANYRSYLKRWPRWLKKCETWPRWLKKCETYVHSVVLPAAALVFMPEKDFRDIIGTIVGVRDDYCVIDDEEMSQIENDEQNEAWDKFYRREFREKLKKFFEEYEVGTAKLPGRDPEAEQAKIDDILDSDEVIDNFFYTWMQDHSNGGEWTEDYDGGQSLDVDRVFEEMVKRGSIGTLWNTLVHQLFDDPRQLSLPFAPEHIVDTILGQPIQEVKSTDLVESVVSRLLEGEHKFSCVMINLPEKLSQRVITWGQQQIPEEDLFVDAEDSKGRELEPHVTVKYGLLDAQPTESLLAVLRQTASFEIKLLPITLFRSDDYDVVKLDAASAQLLELNREVCSAAPYHDTFPDYHPHVTIAYVKKGRGDRLEGTSPFDSDVKFGVSSIGKEGVFDATEVIFSPFEGPKKAFKLGSEQ